MKAAWLRVRTEVFLYATQEGKDGIDRRLARGERGILEDMVHVHAGLDQRTRTWWAFHAGTTVSSGSSV